jgi:autoinducer 2-degrading protein
MFAILFRALAKPDKREELLDFLKRDCKYCENEKETLRFDVLVDAENENAVYVYEAYKDWEAFQAHTKNPHFRNGNRKTTKTV